MRNITLVYIKEEREFSSALFIKAIYFYQFDSRFIQRSKAPSFHIPHNSLIFDMQTFDLFLALTQRDA